MMSKKKRTKKPESTASESRAENEKKATDSDERPDLKTSSPPHAVGYIKDKKTGKWKIVNPAGSMAYNYLYRDEPPDD